MTIKIIGNQWYWRYEYAGPMGTFAHDQTLWEDDTLYGEPRDYLLDPRLLSTWGKNMMIPIQTNVRLLITSIDVLHSWALPAAGIKVDACPGRLNEVFLRINRPCHLFGQCSEICGINHAYMPIHVQAMGPWYVAMVHALEVYDDDFSSTDMESESFLWNDFYYTKARIDVDDIAFHPTQHFNG
jgi:heme/copper-type cytochrome/quinol oxidase subunit 2